MVDLNYAELDALAQKVRARLKELPMAAIENFSRDFDIRYAHESTAIEGNTLTLREVALLIGDKISVGGKNLREIYEVINHDKAFSYVRQLIDAGKMLDEEILKNIHEIIMENIIPGGAYRAHSVRITGASFSPPDPYRLREEMKFFFMDLPQKRELHPIECAAWTHAEFVRIHPFADGNGRTARMIMNYELMNKGFLPIAIKTSDRENYYTALDAYAAEGLMDKFLALVFHCEKETLMDFLAFYSEEQRS
ncbi:MAG: Fic family protein [Selenomonadaceae bacterium]|nr:Fic family protein [Selenomonadaceae bacterium]